MVALGPERHQAALAIARVLDEMDARAQAEPVDLAANCLTRMADGDRNVVDPIGMKRGDMPFQQRPIAKLEQDLRAVNDRSQSPADAGRENDRRRCPTIGM